MGVPDGLIGRVDGSAGQRIEAAIRGHHRRRLRRVGRIAQLEPPEDGRLWATGDPPPRAGCALDVLIDGEQALSAIAAGTAERPARRWLITRREGPLGRFAAPFRGRAGRQRVSSSRRRSSLARPQERWGPQSPREGRSTA
jgi:hypothetical protein